MDEFLINIAGIIDSSITSSDFQGVENAGNCAKYRERMSNE